MGEAFILANLDKQEFAHPHDLDDGYKRYECNNTSYYLAQLVTQSSDDWAGRWAGDRVVYMSEYDPRSDEFYGHSDTWVDVSAEIVANLVRRGGTDE